MKVQQGRRPRSLGRLGLPHALMVMAGLATFVLVASVLRDRSEITQVWLVDTDVAAGAVIDASDLVAVDVAADELILTPLLRVVDGVPVGRVRHGIVAGEPLLASDLMLVDEQVAARTFTVAIDTMVLEGLGLIRGDRVDVIGELSVGDIGYVVVDVEVIRLPITGSTGAFAAAGSRTTWVTVSVDEGQALALSSALDRGDVQLVRSTGATSIAATSIAATSNAATSGAAGTAVEADSTTLADDPQLAADEPES